MDSDAVNTVSKSERDSLLQMLKQYEQTAANLSTQDAATSLNVAE